MKKRILPILLCLTLLLALLPVPALAASGVTYLDYNAETGEFETKTVSEYGKVNGGTLDNWTGWWIVSGNVTITGSINVATGSLHLILMDNCTLNVTKGIVVSANNSLTIYAQSTGDDAGKLIATGTQYRAGIGGNKSSSGSITINGGVVEAKGGEGAAGIGGGRGGSGTVTINGGVVTGTGGENGAGIGGGNGGSGTVTINGGVVTGTGGQNGAGIGGGRSGTGTVTINGGVVTAKGGSYGAGIGGGYNESGTVTINGGTVTSTGGTGAAGIGGGYTNPSTSTSTVTITGGFVTATGGTAASMGGTGAAIGTGSLYGNNKGTEVAESNFTNAVVLRQSGWATTLTGTVYGDPTLTTDATVPNGITLTIPANSTLTIDGDATLTNNGTITVEDTLKNDGTIMNNGTINGAVTGSGRIIVDGNIVIKENYENKTGAASLAHEVAPAYTVTIPASVTIDGTATVSASGVRVDYGKQVVVRLSGINGSTTDSAFTVALEGDSNETLAYTVSASGNVTSQSISKNDAVLAVNPADATETALASGTTTLNFALAGTVKYAGSYTGTVTFTVSVENVPDTTGGTD